MAGRPSPDDPGRARPSDRFDRFERLAAVGAVADRPTLGRPEEVLDHRAARTAVRARDARLEVDEPAGRARRPTAPGGAMPAARSAARPAGLMRSEVHGTSKVAVTSTGRPKAASRSAIDDLMSSSAGQPTNVGRISTRIGPLPGAGPTSTRWMIPRSTTESIGSSGSITSVSAARTAASSTRGARRAAGRRRRSPRTVPVPPRSGSRPRSPSRSRVGAPDRGEFAPQPAEVGTVVEPAPLGVTRRRRHRKVEVGEDRGDRGAPAASSSVIGASRMPDAMRSASPSIGVKTVAASGASTINAASKRSRGSPSLRARRSSQAPACIRW